MILSHQGRARANGVRHPVRIARGTVHPTLASPPLRARRPDLTVPAAVRRPHHLDIQW